MSEEMAHGPSYHGPLHDALHDAISPPAVSRKMPGAWGSNFNTSLVYSVRSSIAALGGSIHREALDMLLRRRGKVDDVRGGSRPVSNADEDEADRGKLSLLLLSRWPYASLSLSRLASIYFWSPPATSFPMPRRGQLFSGSTSRKSRSSIATKRGLADLHKDNGVRLRAAFVC